MPTLTIVPQFVSQTATGGRISWTNTSNLNIYNDGLTASATTVSADQICQDITLSVAPQPALAGAVILGVRFRVHTRKDTVGSATFFAFYYNAISAPNEIRAYFESSDSLALREAGSLTTIAPAMTNVPWTAGFNIIAVGEGRTIPTGLYIDGLQLEVVYAEGGGTAAAILLLDE